MLNSQIQEALKLTHKQASILIPNRLIFFDNLRGLIIVFVTFFHSTMDYSLLDTFWRRVIPLDVFMMLILFFIAGYFGLPSLQKKGVKCFLISKLKRLGLPLILSITFVLPILDYLHYHYNAIQYGLSSFNLSEYWVSCVTKICEFNLGLLNINDPFYMPDQFYLHYLWFLSLLIVFFVVLCGFYIIKKEWIVEQYLQNEKSRNVKQSFLIKLAFFGLLLSGYYYTMIQFVPSEATFFTMGNLIQLQPARLGLYFGGFFLGVYAFIKNWFHKELTISVIKNGSITLLLLIGTITVGKLYFDTVTPTFELQFTFIVLYNFLCLSFLLLIVTAAKKYWDTPAYAHQKLTLNSYNIYLFHYIPIIIIQLILNSFSNIPIVARSIIVFCITLTICFGISEYLIRPLFARLKLQPKKSLPITIVN